MPTPIETEYLFTLQGTIGEPTVMNNLMVFEVETGSIKGENISGTMTGPRGDWIRLQPSGSWRLDVRFNLKMDDDSDVYVSYSGVVRMTEAFAERIASGDTIDGDEIYFRSAPYFETNSEKYAWLQDTLCIGRLRSFGGGKVVYDIHKVL